MTDEPRTAAGREWLALLTGKLPDGLLPAQYGHISDAILAIEAEASRIDVERLATAMQKVDGLYRWHVGKAAAIAKAYEAEDE
jgi:hypothetical protein